VSTVEDVDGVGGFVVVAVGGPWGAVFGAWAFGDAGLVRARRLGRRVGQDGVADGADEVDGGAGDDAGGVDDLVAGGVEGDGEAGGGSGGICGPGW